eukprot:10323-Heterococcus_DN1.PRE.8
MVRGFQSIDPKSIKVEKAVNLESGNGYLIRLAHGPLNEAIKFQTPLLPLAWGVGVREVKGKPGCALPLSLGGGDARTAKFSQWLMDVNNHLKQMAIDNSVEWYGKQLTLESINDDIFTELVKIPKDPRYSSTYLPKIDFDINDYTNLNVKVFDVDKKPVSPLEYLTQHAKVCAIIEIPYIFLSKNVKRVSIKSEVTQCFSIPAPKEDEFGFNFEDDPELNAAVDAAEEAHKRKLEEVGTSVNNPVASEPSPAAVSEFSEFDSTAVNEELKAATAVSTDKGSKKKRKTDDKMPELFAGDDV